jgi:hypothetical protein
MQHIVLTDAASFLRVEFAATTFDSTVNPATCSSRPMVNGCKKLSSNAARGGLHS